LALRSAKLLCPVLHPFLWLQSREAALAAGIRTISRYAWQYQQAFLTPSTALVTLGSQLPAYSSTLGTGVTPSVGVTTNVTGLFLTQLGNTLTDEITVRV
jgi:hypothetical protein